MFHCEIRHRFHWLSKSWIITLIGFFQAYWFAITSFVIPLYLFSIFKSEFLVWKIETITAVFGIIFTGLLSFLLLKIKRHLLLKIAFLIWIFWIIYFLFIQNIFDATIAKISLRISSIFIISVLSLYLRDFSKERELAKKEWIYCAINNLSWLTWPILSWFLINFIQNNKIEILAKYTFLEKYSEWLEYNILIAIWWLFLIISILIFIFWKFVINHPHLQKNTISKNTKNIHKLSHLSFISDYFKNKERKIAFISVFSKWVWMIFLYIFLWIFLSKNWTSNQNIWLIIWLLCLPNILIEGFAGKFSEKFWGEIKMIIYWYLIFSISFLIALIIWIKNIYFFTGFLMLSQVGFSLTEALNNVLYFKWTNILNENKYFSIYKMWDAIWRFVTPIIAWFFISIYWIEKVFFALPIIILFNIWIIIHTKNS